MTTPVPCWPARPPLRLLEGDRLRTPPCSASRGPSRAPARSREATSACGAAPGASPERSRPLISSATGGSRFSRPSRTRLSSSAEVIVGSDHEDPRLARDPGRERVPAGSLRAPLGGRHHGRVDGPPEHGLGRLEGLEEIRVPQGVGDDQEVEGYCPTTAADSRCGSSSRAVRSRRRSGATRRRPSPPTGAAVPR
jgi:hypothetical protein